MKKRAFSSIENVLNDSVYDFVTSKKKPKPNRFQVPTDEEDIKKISNLKTRGKIQCGLVECTV